MNIGKVNSAIRTLKEFCDEGSENSKECCEVCPLSNYCDDTLNFSNFEEIEEKKTRAFKNGDELIETWNKKINGNSTGFYKKELQMPLIWIRCKSTKCNYLITGFLGSGNIDISGVVVTLDELYSRFEFLDGSICGVKS